MLGAMADVVPEHVAEAGSEVVVIEFTVEPFSEGSPGAHVLAAVEAVRTFGVEPAMGPFATSVSLDRTQAGALTRAVVDAALAAGATRVNTTVERV